MRGGRLRGTVGYRRPPYHVLDLRQAARRTPDRADYTRALDHIRSVVLSRGAASAGLAMAPWTPVGGGPVYNEVHPERTRSGTGDRPSPGGIHRSRCRSGVPADSGIHLTARDGLSNMPLS